MKRFNLSKNVYYHIFNRSVSKMAIFKSDLDYKFFIDKITQLVARFNMQVVKYCIMPNHYHFLLKNDIDAKFISKFFQSLQLSYARRYNKKYEHSGHVFQGSYKLNIVKSQGDFNRIKKYITDNPIKAGLVKAAKDWPHAG